ncbi:MAG: ZIP family zinc transporter [Acidimicrobiia bacterium]
MGEAFFWGLLGGSSLILGAAIVFRRDLARRTLGLVMGFGAGVLLSAVSFELIDEALTVSGGQGGTALGFFAGAIVFYLGDTLIARLNPGGEQAGPGGLSIVLGTVLDGIPESAVLGLTLLKTGDIGVSMLVAVFVSNLPESIGASSDLLSSGWKRSRVLALWTGVAIVSAVSAATGYTLLDGASPQTLAFVLAFAGGSILTMLSTTMIPEAFEEARRPVGLATTLGFAVALAITLLAS